MINWVYKFMLIMFISNYNTNLCEMPVMTKLKLFTKLSSVSAKKKKKNEGEPNKNHTQ